MMITAARAWASIFTLLSAAAPAAAGANTDKPNLMFILAEYVLPTCALPTPTHRDSGALVIVTQIIGRSAELVRL